MNLTNLPELDFDIYNEALDKYLSHFADCDLMAGITDSNTVATLAFQCVKALFYDDQYSLQDMDLQTFIDEVFAPDAHDTEMLLYTVILDSYIADLNDPEPVDSPVLIPENIVELLRLVKFIGERAIDIDRATAWMKEYFIPAPTTILTGNDLYEAMIDSLMDFIDRQPERRIS